MKIYTTRFSNLLSQHGLLKGASTSILKGTSTTSSLIRLHTAMEQARQTKCELFAFLDDKSKAFDKCTYKLIQIALTRLGLPYQFVNFYVSEVLENRSLHVRTAIGKTSSFTPLCGIPQGGSESSLLFLLSELGVLVLLQLWSRSKAEASNEKTNQFLNFIDTIHV